ncbi:threonine/serine exporter family protein [Pararhodospirillum photometricum]|nr:threonine/serine exporter family protein [Pararhodospirillum photometricum]
MSALLLKILAGAVGAAGFGLLFNISLRALPWAAAIGALALLVRSLGLLQGWPLEAASFAAALAVGATVQALHAQTGMVRSALAVAGCIPLVPGGIAAQAILGLFALTTLPPSPEIVAEVGQACVRVLFTFGAIGIGVSLPLQLFRRRLDL